MWGQDGNISDNNMAVINKVCIRDKDVACCMLHVTILAQLHQANSNQHNKDEDLNRTEAERAPPSFTNSNNDPSLLPI